MVVRMRHNRSQVGHDRSHHALKERMLSTCSHCGAFHLPHHMCLSCGWYNGRQVMDLAAEKTKRDQRLKEKRERISVDAGVPNEPAPASREIAEGTKSEEKSKNKSPRKARGAAAKRLKDESESQSSSGTE